MAVRGELTTRPDPDPTLLTTENLRREIANLKEQVNIRLDSNDKAIGLVQVATDTAVANLNRLIMAHIDALAKVTDERFSGISIQFAERDKRTEQLSLADKTAIAAALQAQKEAAGATNESNSVALTKMENNFTKLIEQGQQLFQTSMASLMTQLADVKTRLDTGEGQSKGIGNMWGFIGIAAGLVIALAALLVHH